MFYSKTVPDRMIGYSQGEIDFAKSVAFTLIHNGVTFMLDKIDGQWEFVVSEQDRKQLDMVIRHLELI